MGHTRPVADTFVGRDHELAVLGGIRQRALNGRRQLALVSGEPGIGKTWFCERAAADAERCGFDVVRGRCWSHGGAPPLWPWPTVLSQLTGPRAARLLAEDRGHGEVDPERFARFAAAADLLATARAGTPTMIILDDMHCADEGALLLTRFFAGVLDRLPLLLVLVRRAGEVASGPGAEALLTELERDATTVTLRRFDMHDTVALLAAHRRPDLDRTAVRDLLRVTGGIPLHLTRAVGDGLVGGGLVGGGPTTVQAAIAGAIGRLPPGARKVLAFAAVLGVDASAGETAQLAGVTNTDVHDAMTLAAKAGLVQISPDGYTLHDVVRDVALDGVGAPQRLLDAHADAAVLLGATAPPERVAHHALAAAARSDADADAAIAACRRAAASLRRGFAYEQAAALLERAVALVAHRPMGADRADLLIERADAVLACGRLIEARAVFRAAADAAEQSGDPTLMARAALGLGGMWVHEHRNPAVRRHVLARQRAALEALPVTERVLRARLSVRLAAEAVYEGEPLAAVQEALARVRDLGDDHALAEALSLTHHAMLAPEHASARPQLATDQIAAASAAGDGVLALFGLMWRTVDLFLLGDGAAERSLAELRQRSEALGAATVNYVVACIDVMRLTRAGRLSAAERAAEACLQDGLAVGDADATGYYGAQLLTIRWLQGRDEELAELLVGLAASPTLAMYEYGFQAGVASVLARGGRLAEARAVLDQLQTVGLSNIPRSSTWLSAMAGLVETAQLLGDRPVAAEVAALLAPFAAHPAMPSLAVTCLGSVARALGLAAMTVGDRDAAVTHLEHAVAANTTLAHRPACAVSKADLATALLARGRPGDLPRAGSLLAAAVSEAESMEMPRRAAIWRELAATIDPPDATGVLRRTGSNGWTMHVGRRRIDLPGLVGLGYLSHLLERPGEDVAAVDLCAAIAVGDRHEVLDAVALAAYRRRVRELDTELADADADADLGRAERLRLERDAVLSELRSALGLGGRVRGFTAAPERARTAVRKAVKRALDVIEAADPVLGAELRADVSTGFTCRYGSAVGSVRRWRVERP